MSYEELSNLYKPLYSGFVNLVDIAKRPLLAHYTSLEVLEKIMINNELWFSNPLFMNDLQEIRFGMLEGRRAFDEICLEDDFIAAIGSVQRVASLKQSFQRYFREFDSTQVLDTFVFCLSEHDPNNFDGLLSMWRGYGANGHGVALVFNTDFMEARVGSPLLIAKVRYETNEQRVNWIKGTFRECAQLSKKIGVVDNELRHIATHMFTLMKIASILSKHDGFKEEAEWRIIYVPDRDDHKLFTENFSYVIGKNGIEPKLRFKIEPLKLEPADTWTFFSILDRIILGPSFSWPQLIERMFKVLNKTEFTKKVVVSKIPFRATK